MRALNRKTVAVAALLALPLTTGGCDAGSQAMSLGLFGASVAIFHRTPVDMVYSSATGKDCSMVRWDRGESYCKPPEPEPTGQPYCTRSLGTVDCWSRPEAMRDLPPPVADGPTKLTPAQEHDRNAGWLNL